jgi:hypothetical protein
MKTQLLLLSLIFCCFSYLEAQIIYVDASNSTGTENGSELHPFNTIKEGITAASPGTRLIIKQGTYIPDDSWSGNTHTLLLKAGVSLLGEGADKTIIQGIVVDQENSNLSIGLEKLRFDEFYFSRGSHTGPFTELNIVRDCSANYIDLLFGAGFPVNDTTPGPNYGFLIENNDLGTEGIIDFKQGAGVSNLTVQNNSCGYIYLKSGGGYTYLIDHNDIEYGVFDASATNYTTISNNTIYNGGINDKSGGNQYGIEDQIIENNTISADENSPAFAEEDYKAAIIAKSRSVTIRNNKITCTGHVSGIRTSAGAPMHILDNTVILEEVLTPDPDPYEGTSGIFNYSGWGKVTGNKISGGNMGYYSKAGTVEFARNEIERSYTGFYSMGAESVHHNLIKECKGDGMILNGLKGPVFANTVNDNEGSGILVLRTPVDLGGGKDTCPGLNLITGNGNFDLYIMANAVSSPLVYARYNVWDHTDTLDIMQNDIHDGYDSTGCAKVSFTPPGHLGLPDHHPAGGFSLQRVSGTRSIAINWYMNSPGLVTIRIFDMNGREIMQSYSGYYEVGYHQLNLQLNELVNAIYICNLTTGNFSRSAKFTAE